MKTISLYQFIILLHIFFAFTMFSLWVTEFIFVLTNYKQKFTLKVIQRLQMISMIIVLASGLYLMRIAWGPKQWLTTSVLLLISVIPVSVIVTQRAIKAERAGNEPLEWYFRLTSSVYKILTAVIILSLMVLKHFIESELIIVMPFAYGGLAIGLVAVYLAKLKGV